MGFRRYKIRLACAFVVMAVFLFCAGALQAAKFEQGDWVNYTNFKYVSAIAADQKVVYFGTTGGIIRYDRFADEWLDPLTASGGLPSNDVRGLAYDPQYNELWVMTARGAAKYNLTFESWYVDSDFPENLVINNWNSARFRSLFTPFRYDYVNGQIMDPNMRKYPITVGFEDDNDLMYIGTWGLGVGIINTRLLRYEPMAYGPFNYNISKVVEIDGDLWMGTDYTLPEQGITRYDLQSAKWDYFESPYTFGLGNTEITSGIGNGEITWLGTRGGLVKVENVSSFTTYGAVKGLPSDRIMSLAEYGGYIYVGTDNGLGLFPSGGDTPDSAFATPLTDDYLLHGRRINDLLVFHGTLYIATEDGAFAYDADSLKFKSLDTPAGDLNYGVNDIFAEADNLYFAARFGVVIIDMQTESPRVATDPSLADHWSLREIYGDKRYIWAATSLGLWRYKKADMSTNLYTIADGLPTNDLNSLVVDGDYLWLGSNQGLVRFFWNDPGRGD